MIFYHKCDSIICFRYLEKLLLRNVCGNRLQGPFNEVLTHLNLFCHRQINVTAWIGNRDSRYDSGASDAPCHCRHVGNVGSWNPFLFHFFHHRCTATRTAASGAYHDCGPYSVHLKLFNDFASHLSGFFQYRKVPCCYVIIVIQLSYSAFPLRLF